MKSDKRDRFYMWYIPSPREDCPRQSLEESLWWQIFAVVNKPMVMILQWHLSLFHPTAATFTRTWLIIQPHTHRLMGNILRFHLPMVHNSIINSTPIIPPIFVPTPPTNSIHLRLPIHQRPFSHSIQRSNLWILRTLTFARRHSLLRPICPRTKLCWLTIPMVSIRCCHCKAPPPPNSLPRSPLLARRPRRINRMMSHSTLLSHLTRTKCRPTRSRMFINRLQPIWIPATVHGAVSCGRVRLVNEKQWPSIGGKLQRCASDDAYEKSTKLSKRWRDARVPIPVSDFQKLRSFVIPSNTSKISKNSSGRQAWVRGHWNKKPALTKRPRTK